MTNKELQEELKKYPDDYEVYFDGMDVIDTVYNAEHLKEIHLS